MLALMGFPIFGGAGFFAKWYVLQAALQAPVKQTTLAVVLVLTTVVSAGYYLYVVMVMFMRPRPRGRSGTGARGRSDARRARCQRWRCCSSLASSRSGRSRSRGAVSRASSSREFDDGDSFPGVDRHRPARRRTRGLRSRGRLRLNRQRRRSLIQTGPRRGPVSIQIVGDRMAIAAGIFRQYDIRGIVGKDLTTEAARAIGGAYAAYLAEHGMQRRGRRQPRQPAERRGAARRARRRTHRGGRRCRSTSASCRRR